MQFIRTNINKTYRNGELNVSNVAVTNVGGGGGSSSLSGNFLPAVNNGDGSYTVDLSKVVFTGNLIGEGEITAYGQGSTGGGSTSTGSVTIYDGLDSVAVDAALSANQGRILREMILEAGTGGSTLLSKLEDVTLTNLADGQILKYDATSKKWVNGDGTKVTWTNIEGKPAALTDANIAKWNENSHTHTNKTTLDKITEANLTSWNNKLDKAIWDKAFYFDSAGDLRAKVNVIGEKEISAYGAGASGGSGSITIVDALTSTATDAALSANQGRILRELIDSKGEGGVTNWADLEGKPSWIGANKPSYTWAEISGKPSTFAPSSHTHNYASTVKVGSTSYNINGNTISLPAYPTVPSALKNPNALTISLNGTSQGAYDGSAAKSFNITAASVGAAASSHSHSYLPLNGGTLTGNVIFSTDSTLTWNRNTDSFSIGFKNTGDSDADSYGWMKMADNGNEYFKWLQVSGSTTTELMSLKSDGLRFKGIKVSLEGHSHSYAGSSSVGGAATSANKVNSTLAFTGGTFAAKSFDGSSNQTVNIPTHTSHLTNNSGFITSSATVAAANKVTNTLTFTGYQSKSFNGSTAVSVAIPNNTNQLTNGAGFITSSASISGNAGSATKLQTARTLWGQSFNGTGNVGGNIIGAYFKINDTQTNPYLQLTQGSTWYVQGYNGYLYLGAGSTNSIKIDSAGNLLSPKEITAYSDIRLKKNIRPLENRGYILPIVYERDGKQSIGFSAQEVRELYPELVIEDNTEDKYLSVNYAQYVAVLQAQIIDLKKEIDELKNIKTK